MSSNRALSRILESNQIPYTHCLVEWQEPGNPVNVVSANHVESGGVLKVGDLCSVKVKEVSRMVSYPAKILGMGTKAAMELELSSLDSADGDDYGDGGDDAGSETDKDNDVSPEIEVQSTMTKKTTKNGRAQSAIRARVSKQKTLRENLRMTEELLRGLDDSPTPDPGSSPPSISSPTSHTRPAPHPGYSPPSICSPTSHTRPAPHPGSSPPSRHTSPSPHNAHMPPRNHFSRSHRSTRSRSRSRSPHRFIDFTEYAGYNSTYPKQSTPKDTRNLSNRICLSEDAFQLAVQSQLQTLRHWMELQFLELNRKVDGISADLKRRRQSKKVHLDLAGDFGKAHLEVDREQTLTPTQARQFCFEGDQENTSARQPLTDTSSNQRTSSSSGSLTETEVICGNPRDRRGHIKVNLASTLAVKQFQQLLNCPPDDPGRCALKLLTIFFTESELAKGNCTKAGGRELLDQHLLHGIKCQVNHTYPLHEIKATEKRWQAIVVKQLNGKCRTMRKKLRPQQENMNPPPTL